MYLACSKCGVRASSRATAQARPGRATSVKVQALFGWGKKDNSKDEEKEEAFRAQQELLQKRKTGELIQEANQRRQKVKDTVGARKAERKQERDLLAQGIMPETLKNWKPYMKKEDETAGMDGRIVVPLLPFGIKKFDEGERFDLRSPYSDDGWVDPDETDAFAGLKKIGSKILNFSGKEPESQQGKPIIWASQYEKYKREKEQQ